MSTGKTKLIKIKIAAKIQLWHAASLHTHMNDEPYKITGDMLTVCAWCHPSLSIFEAYPGLKTGHFKLSHGICPTCKAKMLEQIRAAKNPCHLARGE